MIEDIINMEEALVLEAEGKIIIYNPNVVESKFSGNKVWINNFIGLRKKYRKVPIDNLLQFMAFEYRIEHKSQDNVEPFATTWVYMYAKDMVGKVQLDEMHSKGQYVYILTNVAYPGYCKIGKAVTPSKRVKQINGAGTVSEWKLEYALPVTDDYKVEALIHSKLALLRRDSHQGSSREFFEISLEDALEVLILLGSDFSNGELIKY
jgi:hypothetical protein